LRTATGQYRTTPLRGLRQHAPYFHDGSAADLRAVVNHYNRQFQLNLTRQQRADLVEFLNSLRAASECLVGRNAPIGYDSSAPPRRIRCALMFAWQGSEQPALNTTRER
jgi:hypothetical protein